ncbi:tetratricopeptide repeat protein [Pseudosulfitobacter koreensis]|uniref:Tetratricopeptide repeat protein 38 n=1 Tax=Pseudosulfitobacter koreensis TaxID=2968472 RepID=A0ABT1Z2U9_9RHOB|nr:tetratricopeptide repeat protein [Pseudosulfitobacter koreense]MCR8827461.1 tetratricopeptide repeat protein [Pseudosulfitobacter koreense]
MQSDICDSPISLDDPVLLDHWNGVITGFLSHGTQTPVHLGKVLEGAPDFAMGHAARGLFSLMMGRAELIAVAREAHEAALTALSRESAAPREKLWVQALGEWLQGRPSGAIAAMEAALRLQPRDTLSAKVSHAIRFVLGDARGMRASVEAVLDAHTIHPMRGYLLGCHAFTLEETGDYAAAERTGLRGLEHAPDDAWGLHAVAHVYDMTARPDAGIALIDDHKSAWDHCNNFRHHVWWHKALLHLDRGEMDVVLALYDQQIRADKTDDYRDIANATSLLMRLELDGMDVGDRWDELAAFSEARVEDGCLVFADLHYMLALSGARKGAAADAMCARFARDAIRHGEMAQRVADPGLAAVAGLHAFAEGRWDQAFQNLAAARASMQSIGGSHAQRDVFERMTIDAGLRAGRVERTALILAQRTDMRGGHQDRFAQIRAASISSARRIAAQ